MYPNLIAGAWVKSHELNSNINPSDTRDAVGEYARAEASQVHAAIAAGAEARGRWSRTTPQTRAEILEKIGQSLLSEREALGRLLSREEGKILSEGIAEVTRAAQIFKFFSGEALRLTGDRLDSVRPNVIVDVVREPVGTVGIITPWNFPLAIPAWKIAPALAFGNTVVFKPADLVPASAWELSRIAAESGVPDGVLNLVMGRGPVVGAALQSARDIDAISFTGSANVGKQLGVACVASGKRVQLEMGGKNPMIIMNDADLETAVRVSLEGAYYSTGQRCTASSRLIVDSKIHDAFVDAMASAISALKVGHALEAGIDIGPVASQDQLQQNLEYVDIARKEGAEIVGGEVLERSTPGYYMQPALFVGTTNSMRVNREEIFGPIASVIRVDGFDEALAVANDTEFGLSSGICTTSLKYCEAFKRGSTSGMVMVNLPTAGVDYHVPFGGRKSSSFGPREQGSYAREFYTSVKTAYTMPY